MIQEMEDILPELLVTDLLDYSQFDKYQDLLKFYHKPPLNMVETDNILCKQKAMNFFISKFDKVNDLYKMSSEPLFYVANHRARVNTTDVGLSACYLECILFDSNLALTKSYSANTIEDYQLNYYSIF